MTSIKKAPVVKFQYEVIDWAAQTYSKAGLIKKVDNRKDLCIPY